MNEETYRTVRTGETVMELRVRLKECDTVRDAIVHVLVKFVTRGS